MVPHRLAPTRRKDTFYSSESYVNACERSVMTEEEEESVKRNLLRLVPYSDPCLREATEDVTFPLTKGDEALALDMLFSVSDKQLHVAGACWSSAAGMSANQWGHSKRIFVIRRHYIENPATGKKMGASENFVVCLNPSYENIREDGEEDWAIEGCFSIPGKRGRVRRFSSIAAQFQSMDGTKRSMRLTGWAARVFQHETDHTNGRLYDDAVAGRCQRVWDMSEAEEVAVPEKTVVSSKEEDTAKEDIGAASSTRRTLSFSNQFIEWIRSGKKIATTRVDNFVFEDGTVENVGSLRVGEIVDATDDDDRAFCALKIRRVEHRTYGSLDDDLARIENFTDASELRKVLRHFYPGLEDESKLVIVYFEAIRD
eukprot:g1305.t1